MPGSISPLPTGTITMQITSTAFENGGTIPERCSRDGREVSPPLVFGDVPEQTQTMAVIVDDPDAPGKVWVHWLIWNIPGDRRSIPEGVPPQKTLASLDGAKQGTNDYGEIGYGGPRPPRGHGAHHYRFTAYALNEMLDVEAGADREAIESAMRGKILAQSRITGAYERK